jgi:hypothetical protein
MTPEQPLHTPDRKQPPSDSVHDRLHSAATALSDPDHLGRVVFLAGAEREATVELVAHLAELDARRLYLGQGYGSLFTYCTGALRLAEHAAYNRIEVARASRHFPAILDLLVDGSLNLATARLLAPHLRPDNFDEVVAMARGKSKREVEVLVARLAPGPDVPSSVRKLPGAAIALARAAADTGSAEEQPTALLPQPDACAAAPPAAALVEAGSGIRAAEALGTPPSVRQAFFHGRADRAVVAPLAPARYRVQFTVGEETHEKLRRVQDLLRREIPDGDPGAIFDRALALLLEDVGRKKLAETSKSRPAAAPATCRAVPAMSRAVPASVRRAVWMRDAGRCAFVAANGQRCTERAFLELHHQEPFALGGEATVENVALRCRAHHAYETELAFGPRAGDTHECADDGRAGEGTDSPRGESEVSRGGRESTSPRSGRGTPRACRDAAPMAS